MHSDFHSTPVHMPADRHKIEGLSPTNARCVDACGFAVRSTQCPYFSLGSIASLPILLRPLGQRVSCSLRLYRSLLPSHASRWYVRWAWGLVADVSTCLDSRYEHKAAPQQLAR
jgi:hypothetical protein